jgi:hypothetical protein
LISKNKKVYMEFDALIENTQKAVVDIENGLK